MPERVEQKTFRKRDVFGSYGGVYDAYYLGVYTMPSWSRSQPGRQYHAWRPVGNAMQSWVRLEPLDGKRAVLLYDPGKSVTAARLAAEAK